MPAEPIRFYAGRLPPRELDIEREEEEMEAGRTIEPFVLGAYSGIRSMTGPAFAARHFGRNPLLARVLTLLAANEFLVDKIPGIPPRTHPLSLAARATSGALVASLGEGNRKTRIYRGIAGAVGAVTGAYAFTSLRVRAVRRSPLLGTLFGLAEDAIVLLAQRRLADG